MSSFLNKHKRGLVFLIFFLIILFPMKTFAHNAYFLQVLIDDHKFQYVGSVVEDNASYFETETKHLETEMGKFAGLPMDVRPNKETEEGYLDYEKNLTDEALIFTFNPKEMSTWYGKAKNHATAEDANKAFRAQENLMTGLNDALKIVNGGKDFTSVKQLTSMSQKLAMAINGSGTIDGYTIKKGKAFDDAPPEGFKKDDYITITKNGTDGKEKYEFIYRMNKGYKDSDVSEYDKDTQYLTWNQLMYQGNYAMIAKGFTLKNGAELVKPGPVEEAVVGMLGNTFNQLRNLLGLYDINDLVFNDGIRGSSAWTHGIMAKDWSDKAIAYHWVFQALAWTVITFAIVKNLIQRNFATINPAMRISLMENIQDLLITGFLLANAIPVINMLMFLNAKLVAVFASTAPDFANLGELNAYSSMLGGILIQFFYLGVSIYLNFVYIMRAITIAILIASAPLFIVSIAFGGKWKQLFNTWMRELVGNIFLQSFHAFMLSFFFAISTSSRGIEGMIVLMALIPMTEFFRTLVMGQGGGIAHSMGMKSMSQAGTLVGGALSAVSGGGKAKQNGTSTGGGSGREVTTTSGDSGMNNYAGNSDKIKNNSEAMNQRQRMNSTKQTMANKQTPINVADKNGSQHGSLDSFKGSDLATAPSTKLEKALNMAQAVPDVIKDSKDKFDNSAVGKFSTGAVSTALGVAKTSAGVAQMAVGLGTAMAVGTDPKTLKNVMGGGKDLIGNGLSQTVSNAPKMGQGAGEGLSQMGNMATKGGVDRFKAQHLPNSTKAYATTLPNGDMQIHRTASSMADAGILGAKMDGGNAQYTYDVGKLSPTDRQNLYGHAYNAFKNHDPNNEASVKAVQHYQNQGIQYVRKDNSGNMVVGYNQQGMEKLGIKSVQTIGATGSNPRIVETKGNSQPIDTLKTLDVNRYVPTPTKNSNTNGNTNGNSNRTLN